MKSGDRIDDLKYAPKFVSLHERVRGHTVTSVERQFALFQAVRYIVRTGIPGDFVECGVGGGGSSLLVALTLGQLGVCDRRLWLYDTFAGMTEPTVHDIDFRGRPVEDVLRQKGRSRPDEQSNHPLEKVRAVMARSDYPSDRITYVEGDVLNTVPATVPSRIALLRLDTDWYKSTRHELEHLYPRLARSGVLIIDDYGHWRGCRRAVDGYFKGKPILLNRIDYTGRIAVKTEDACMSS